MNTLRSWASKLTREAGSKFAREAGRKLVREARSGPCKPNLEASLGGKLSGEGICIAIRRTPWKPLRLKTASFCVSTIKLHRQFALVMNEFGGLFQGRPAVSSRAPPLRKVPALEKERSNTAGSRVECSARQQEDAFMLYSSSPESPVAPPHLLRTPTTAPRTPMTDPRTPPTAPSIPTTPPRTSPTAPRTPPTAFPSTAANTRHPRTHTTQRKGFKSGSQACKSTKSRWPRLAWLEAVGNFFVSTGVWMRCLMCWIGRLNDWLMLLWPCLVACAQWPYHVGRWTYHSMVPMMRRGVIPIALVLAHCLFMWSPEVRHAVTIVGRVASIVPDRATQDCRSSFFRPSFISDNSTPPLWQPIDWNGMARQDAAEAEMAQRLNLSQGVVREWASNTRLLWAEAGTAGDDGGGDFDGDLAACRAVLERVEQAAEMQAALGDQLHRVFLEYAAAVTELRDRVSMVVDEKPWSSSRWWWWRWVKWAAETCFPQWLTRRFRHAIEQEQMARLAYWLRDWGVNREQPLLQLYSTLSRTPRRIEILAGLLRQMEWAETWMQLLEADQPACGMSAGTVEEMRAWLEAWPRMIQINDDGSISLSPTHVSADHPLSHGDHLFRGIADATCGSVNADKLHELLDALRRVNVFYRDPPAMRLEQYSAVVRTLLHAFANTRETVDCQKTHRNIQSHLASIEVALQIVGHVKAHVFDRQSMVTMGRESMVDVGRAWSMWEEYGRCGKSMVDVGRAWSMWKVHGQRGKRMANMGRAWSVWDEHGQCGTSMANLVWGEHGKPGKSASVTIRIISARSRATSTIISTMRASTVKIEEAQPVKQKMKKNTMTIDWYMASHYVQWFSTPDPCLPLNRGSAIGLQRGASNSSYRAGRLTAYAVPAATKLRDHLRQLDPAGASLSSTSADRVYMRGCRAWNGDISVASEAALLAFTYTFDALRPPTSAILVNQTPPLIPYKHISYSLPPPTMIPRVARETLEMAADIWHFQNFDTNRGPRSDVSVDGRRYVYVPCVLNEDDIRRLAGIELTSSRSEAESDESLAGNGRVEEGYALLIEMASCGWMHWLKLMTSWSTPGIPIDFRYCTGVLRSIVQDFRQVEHELFRNFEIWRLRLGMIMKAKHDREDCRSFIIMKAEDDHYRGRGLSRIIKAEQDHEGWNNHEGGRVEVKDEIRDSNGAQEMAEEFYTVVQFHGGVQQESTRLKPDVGNHLDVGREQNRELLQVGAADKLQCMDGCGLMSNRVVVETDTQHASTQVASIVL
ncbi:uncharacterized protein MYCFIDRAFT_180057 [Pseudocercospora fijiensis CIRAD86]|uniref:Uncharacterized protein n=1 Tax=Pseudocercospora fijiensis (strain CIRAD86) TaxID=383855 RepID=M2ZYI9_PSEFD|nr:uncharacterized protein MYCFIDRAFT_180057 [Pseudocercospora fijiensis CIRAD86]EME77181.1 hypothetical protein MYCFIDRAFT_180057 [Pseudocercospora fijiensis CIRAD86]